MSSFKDIMEAVGLVVDGAGVLVISLGLIIGVYQFIVFGRKTKNPYHRLRQNIGRGILLGLEFLIAADIIRTVAVTPSMENVIVLGIIVLIRTFLSMALQIELEGRWPWQLAQQGAEAVATSAQPQAKHR